MKQSFFLWLAVISSIALYEFSAGAEFVKTVVQNQENQEFKDRPTKPKLPAEKGKNRNAFFQFSSVVYFPAYPSSKYPTVFLNYYHESRRGCDLDSSLNMVYGLYTSIGGVLNYGKMASLLEGSLSFYSVLNDEYYDFSFSLSPEFNFIKNDGINKIIHGIHVSLSVLKVNNENFLSSSMFKVSDENWDFFSYFDLGLELGFYLKAFISDYVALVPVISVANHFIREFHGDVGSSSDKLSMRASLGVRTYF